MGRSHAWEPLDQTSERAQIAPKHFMEWVRAAPPRRRRAPPPPRAISHDHPSCAGSVRYVGFNVQHDAWANCGKYWSLVTCPVRALRGGESEQWGNLIRGFGVDRLWGNSAVTGMIDVGPPKTCPRARLSGGGKRAPRLVHVRIANFLGGGSFAAPTVGSIQLHGHGCSLQPWRLLRAGQTPRGPLLK